MPKKNLDYVKIVDVYPPVGGKAKKCLIATGTDGEKLVQYVLGGKLLFITSNYEECGTIPIFGSRDIFRLRDVVNNICARMEPKKKSTKRRRKTKSTEVLPSARFGHLE